VVRFGNGETKSCGRRASYIIDVDVVLAQIAHHRAHPSPLPFIARPPHVIVQRGKVLIPPPEFWTDKSRGFVVVDEGEGGGTTIDRRGVLAYTMKHNKRRGMIWQRKQGRYRKRYL
jgi:hypothetical protein